MTRNSLHMAIATCPSIRLKWGGEAFLKMTKTMTTTHGTSKASQVSSLHRLEGGIVLEDDSGLLVPNCRGAENDPKFLAHGYCIASFHPT